MKLVPFESVDGPIAINPEYVVSIGEGGMKGFDIVITVCNSKYCFYVKGDLASVHGKLLGLE